MSEPAGAQSLLLDACAVINFAACRRFEDLARFYGGFRIVDVVEQEAHFVREQRPGGETSERTRIDLSSLIANDLLVIESVASDEELATYIEFATVLSDGDAMTLAAALHRSLAVVTDDRKASRIAREHGIGVVATLEIIRRWANDTGIDPQDLRQALIDLRRRGRYFPSHSHPLRSWWEQHNIDE